MGVRVLRKAVACVVRGAPPRAEILVFDHPVAGTQIPKGTMDEGEGVVDAALRELHEESGVRDVVPVGVVGEWARHVGAGPGEDGPPERHDWIVVLMRPAAPLPDAWSHVAVGSPEEEGLVFRYRWVPVDADLAGRLHPLFADVARIVTGAVGSDRT
jgi:8-oxo-dGTP pyrophosphatase MutT (NUDIX family)